MDPYLNSSLWFLRLRDVVPDDSGKYTCIVTNPYGSINHTYTLKVVVKPRSRPILQSDLPRNTTVKLGDNATMECIVLVSGTLPDFRWLKWDKNITSQPKMNGMMKASGSNKLIDPVHYKTIKDGEYHGMQLEIYNVSDNDLGLYTCFVSNHIGYDYNSALLIKSEERPRPTTSEQYPPRFGKKPKVQNNVQVGHDIRLRCSVDGDPPPRLTWVKDQKPLQFSSRIRLISRDNGIVKIKNTQLVDAGYYTCIAANSLGSVNATLKLHVRQEQYPPRFGKKPKVQNNVQVGHDIRLRCSVKGDPPPRLTWVKDQKPLQFSSRIRLISRDNGIVKIKNTQLVDAGYYTCIAANSFGSVNATLELHVRQGSLNPFVPTNQAPTARFSGKHAPPSFTDQESLRRRYRAWLASHTIRLKCEATGAPPLQFRWLKDGQRLLSRRMDPYLNSSLWFLRLRDVVPDDSGKYTCIVTNPYGSINHTYTLKVVVKPRSRPILQSDLPRNTTVKLGDNATMECIVLVSGTLPDFRWLKWDKNITSQPKMNGMMKASGSNKLIDPVHYKTIKDGEYHGMQLEIYNVSDNDLGLYTCFVSNHIGYDYNSALLIKSEERPRPTTSEQYPPRFGKKPKVQNNVQVGHDIRLRCSVKGDPPPRLTWVKDQKPLQFSSRIRLISRDNGIVKIKNTQLVDAGYYTCIAANSLGGVNATLELHVRHGKLLRRQIV
ncbi:hemicentin-1-like isoform X1 [Acropora palmata]|uniref:hemicentin-1-like isoform X1 n=1 Tax=Acropora palmata TaxID=6131 RepID=UPI003DA19A63